LLVLSDWRICSLCCNCCCNRRGRATGDQYRTSRGYPPAKLQSRRTEAVTLGHESMPGWNIQTESVPFLSNYTTLCCIVRELKGRSSVRMFCLRNYWTYLILPNQLNTYTVYLIVRFGTTVPSSGSFYTKF
jgi:hypothetical protein